MAIPPRRIVLFIITSWTLVNQFVVTDTYTPQSQRDQEKATVEVWGEYMDQDLTDRTTAQSWPLTKRCFVAAVISLYTSVLLPCPSSCGWCDYAVLTVQIALLSTLHRPSTS
jgi:hypothetical protein